MTRRPTGRSRRQAARRSRTPTIALPMVGMQLGVDIRAATPDANGQLDTIADLSGNGRTMSIGADEGARPALSADAGAGGAQVATFAAGSAGHYLRSPSFAIANPATHVLVAQITQQLLSTRSIIDGTGFTGRHVLSATPDGYSFAALSAVQSGAKTATWALFVLVINGANSALYIDDMETPVAAGNPGTSAIASGISLFANPSDSTLVQPCKLAGYYLYSHAKDYAAREAMRGYVAQEWGIAS